MELQNKSKGRVDNRMTAYQEIIKLLPQLPFEVLKDVERRTGDWMWSGGNEDDPYIH